MTTSTQRTEQDLPQLAGQAVDRALAARSTLMELRPEETDQVGGAAARLIKEPLTMQPVMTIKPGDWAGPLLAQGIGQVATNPAINAGAITQRQF